MFICVLSKLFAALDQDSLKLLIHVFVDLTLCTDMQTCWNSKWSSPNFNKVGSMKLSKQQQTPWYAEALKSFFLVELEGPGMQNVAQPLLM